MKSVKNKYLTQLLIQNRINIREIYDVSYISVFHKHNWDGGYLSSNGYGGEEKEFYCDLKKMLEFLLKYIQNNKINECIIFPKSDTDIFENWSNREEIFVYQKLSNIFKERNINNRNKDGLVFNPSDYWSFIENIVEGGFLFISNLYIYLPERKVVIMPSHHFEFIFYNYSLNDIEFIESCISTSFNMLGLFQPSSK